MYVTKQSGNSTIDAIVVTIINIGRLATIASASGSFSTTIVRSKHSNNSVHKIFIETKTRSGLKFLTKSIGALVIAHLGTDFFLNITISITIRLDYY